MKLRRQTQNAAVRHRMIALAFASIGPLGLVACQWITQLRDVTEGPPLDSGSDTSSADRAPPDYCNHAYPPAPDGGLPDDHLQIFFATRQFSLLGLEAGTAAPQLASTDPNAPGCGFDLDHDCTCFPGQTARGGASSCTPPEGGPGVCDSEGNGIDNQIGVLYHEYNAIFDIVDAENNSIMGGNSAGIIYLGNYNGTADDSYVTVAFGGSFGTCQFELLDGSDEKIEAGCASPKFDGHDTWYVDTSTSLEGFFPTTDGGLIPSSEAIGWVTGGVLVFPMPNSHFYFGNFNGYGAARISGGDGGVWHLDQGVLGARIHPEAVFTLLLTAGSGSQGTCVANLPTELYQTFHTILCNARDIAYDSKNDFKNLPCDGISLGAGFSAVSANATSGQAPRILECNVDASCN